MEGDPQSWIELLIGQFGVGGLIIAALAWHDWQVQKRNMALNDALLEITKETTRASEAATAALRENSNAIQTMSTLLMRSKPE